MATGVAVLIPLQLGVIALAARQRTGSWSLRGAPGYTRRLPARRLALLGAVTLAWAGIVFTATAPAAEFLQASRFAWWSAGLDYAAHLTDPDRVPRGLLRAAWVAGLAVTTVAVPVVEELYLRASGCRAWSTPAAGRRCSTRCCSRSTTVVTVAGAHPGGGHPAAVLRSLALRRSGQSDERPDETLAGNL